MKQVSALCLNIRIVLEANTAKFQSIWFLSLLLFAGDWTLVILTKRARPKSFYYLDFTDIVFDRLSDNSIFLYAGAAFSILLHDAWLGEEYKQ